MVNEDLKVAILTKMRDAKNVLFGELSPTLTFPMKEAKWNEILDYGKSVGLIKQEKNYQYFRDKMYGQWKTRTLRKKDDKNKTGKGGGRKMKLTPVDEIILDIIGRDSPAVIGLGVEETWGGNNSEASTDEEVYTLQNNNNDYELVPVGGTNNFSDEDVDLFGVGTQEDTTNNTKKSAVKCFTPIQNKIKELGIKKGKTAVQLKRKKMELQIDVLLLEKRKKMLEVYELEKRLEVEHHQSTIEGLGIKK